MRRPKLMIPLIVVNVLAVVFVGLSAVLGWQAMLFLAALFLCSNIICILVYRAKLVKTRMAIAGMRFQNLYKRHASVVKTRSDGSIGDDDKYRRMLENLPVCVFELDSEYRFSYLNNNARRLFGATGGKSPEGSEITEYIAPTHRSIVWESFRKLSAGEKMKLNDHVVLQAAGGFIPTLMRSVLRVEHDTVIGIRSTVFELESNFDIAKLPSSEFYKKYEISEREREVLLLFLRKCSYNVIAEKLFISIRTVNTHITNIYRKTGVNSRDQLLELVDRFLM